MLRNTLIRASTVALGVVLFASPALAHVVVKPNQLGVGERANFAVSVPTEEDTPTVQLRLVIPEGLKSVRPNVKPGWNIQLKKTGEGEAARVSEIIWSGGRIPAEQRDEFVFSAQAPAAETTLAWKAYQTYGDGDIVAWENDPKVVEEYSKNNPVKEGEEDDHNAPRPYSETKVINDLKASPAPAVAVETSTTTPQSPAGDRRSSLLSILSLVVSVIALGAVFLKRPQTA